MRRLLFLALPFALAGCSTIYDASGKTPLKGEGPHVYGGIRTIAAGGGFVRDYSGIRIEPNDPWVAAMVMAPFVIDIGLSVITDTLLLPVSLFSEAGDTRP